MKFSRGSGSSGGTLAAIVCHKLLPSHQPESGFFFSPLPTAAMTGARHNETWETSADVYSFDADMSNTSVRCCYGGKKRLPVALILPHSVFSQVEYMSKVQAETSQIPGC